MEERRRGFWIGAALLVLLFAIEALLVHAGIADRFDRALLAALRDAADPGLARASPRTIALAIRLTELGGGVVRIGLALLACALLLALRRGRDAALLAGATATGILAMSLVKALVGRARPDLAWRLIAADHASFPSGHAMGSMITYPLLGMVLGHMIGRWGTRACTALGVLIALLVGTTRILLGVHWASDVIAGWSLGAAWALATLALRTPASKLDRSS
jgi:undecaprenyl-diphosphatase